MSLSGRGGSSLPARLEQDDFSSNRHPALSLCLSMSFFAKPVPTFAADALWYRAFAVGRADNKEIKPDKHQACRYPHSRTQVINESDNGEH